MEKIYTALITPFDTTGRVDFMGLKRILEKFDNEGQKGILVCGTTSESPTLSLKEKENILDFIIQNTRDVSIVMAIGGNDTQKTIQEVRYFTNKKIEALMVVVPYYNRPSQEGLYYHFEEVLKVSTLPILVYNVPSRTGVEISAEVMIRLKQKYPHLIGVKHASRNLDIIKMLKQYIPDFLVYTGEDGYLKESLEAGADGIISVSSHIIYPKIKKLIEEFEYHINQEILDDYIKTIAMYLFVEPSPGPVKYMLYKLGYIANQLRLPMTRVSASTAKKLDEVANNL